MDARPPGAKIHDVRLRHLASHLIAALFLSRVAHSMPAPPVRQPLPVAADSARVSAAPSDALRGACGTSVESLGAMLAAGAARPAVATLPTTHSTDAGGIAVLEDDGTFFYDNKDNRSLVDVAAVGRAFYRTHGDDYDFLAVYVASSLTEWLGSPGALAAAWVVRNDTQGLGLSTYDMGRELGSASRLQSLLTMNSLAIYPQHPDAVVAAGDVFSTMGVLAHEFGHRWLAYTLIDSLGTPSVALLGRDLQHWNFFFDSDSSFMEGCDWASPAPDSFFVDGSVSTFGMVDQYLMGLRSTGEMTPFFTLTAPTSFEPPAPYNPKSVPFVGIGCRATPAWWTVSQLQAQNGPRLPDASIAPHHWRVAFVLLEPNGSAASAADLAKLQVIRTRFPGVIAAATWQRGSVDVSLDSRAGTVRLTHDPLPDTEDPLVLRTLGVRSRIDQAGIPLAVNPGSVTLHWRAGNSGPFQSMTIPPVAADSFAIGFAPAVSGLVQYWLSASSDSAGIGAQLPVAGPAAPFEFHVGPDTQPPVVTHVPVPYQSPYRWPQQLLARVHDNLGVDSVWFESSVDGGPVTAQPVAPSGKDSVTFHTSAAPGLGHRLAYRFVARDASVAHNIGYSNPAFDSLRLVHDAFDDFENPSPTWTHTTVLWSGRDPWELDASDSSPPGGVAWHAGNADGTPYEPHVDGALLVPWIYDVVPGTSIVFDERHDLEGDVSGNAFDGARVEVQAGANVWQPVTPSPGYTHTMDPSSPFLPAGAPCWSGDSHGWVTRTLDLTPYAPGPVQLRVRMSSDDFLGFGGVWIDRVRVRYPDDAGLDVPLGRVEPAVGPAWPNPTRGALRVRLALPRAGRVDWALFDPQGRRVATLWAGAAAAGAHELSGEARAAVPAGLYFSRLTVDGRTVDARRVALIR